jgi:hypothetical protein
MFRIIQFKIPVAQFEQLIEDRPDATRRFYDKAGDLARIDGHYVSLPMSTTSAQFFECEQYLRSLVGDPPHLIDDVTGTFALLRTRAPVAYDYSYVLTIGTMPGEFGEERLVAVPKRSVEYQSGRYASGMFSPIACG